MKENTIFDILLGNLAQRAAEIRAGAETRDLTMVEIRRRVYTGTPAESANARKPRRPSLLLQVWRSRQTTLERAAIGGGIAFTWLILVAAAVLLGAQALRGDETAHPARTIPQFRIYGESWAHHEAPEPRAFRLKPEATG